MNQVVLDIKDHLIKDLKDIFGDKIEKIILYGSYARGEEDSESDIDVMVLVKETDANLKKYDNQILDIILNYSMEKDLLLSIIAKDSSHFYEWADYLPFYNNVVKEGTVLYA